MLLWLVMSDAVWMRALLACLYLDAGDGFARAPRHRAHQVLHCLRVHQPVLSGASCSQDDFDAFVNAGRGVLRQHGFDAEAAILGAQSRCQDFIKHAADSICMVGDSAYPARWLTSMGTSAPLVLWGAPTLAVGGHAHHMGRSPIRWFGVVGSRCPSAESLRLASDAVRQAASMGYGIVTGGAAGVDAAAARAARLLGAPVLNIVPMCGFHGLRAVSCAISTHVPSDTHDAEPAQVPFIARHGARSAENVLSLRPSGVSFSTSAAMERNQLIYAAAECTLVVQPRFKVGGTWHGALSAHQRKLCPLLVAEEPDNMAYRAFRALGFGNFGMGHALSDTGLADAIRAAELGIQPHLPFSAAGA